jgi:hypothetical protein
MSNVNSNSVGGGFSTSRVDRLRPADGKLGPVRSGLEVPAASAAEALRSPAIKPVNTAAVLDVLPVDALYIAKLPRDTLRFECLKIAEMIQMQSETSGSSAHLDCAARLRSYVNGLDRLQNLLEAQKRF